MRTLTREEVIRVIEGKGAAERIPFFYDFYLFNPSYMSVDNPVREEIGRMYYPEDIQWVILRMPEVTEGYPEDPDYYWAIPGKTVDETKGHDDRCVIEDWENEEEVELFYKTFPDAETPGLMPKAEKRERYFLVHYYWTYFERLWQLRGMENALTDFYYYPEQVHRLFERLTVFYIRLMERAKERYDCDGFQMTDDIGAQDRPFFSLEIFREFFKPYYKRIIDKAHELGCHLWMHSCGNIQMYLPELIEIGLDVIHPIQKNTMDEKVVAEEFGPKICILSGIDVQYLFAFGTPEEVEEEVEYLIDTYSRPEGRMMITLGNGYTEDWKVENIHAMYRASIRICEERLKKGRDEKGT